MFQEIAGGLLTFKSLSALPEDLLPTACEIVARSVLMEWHRSVQSTYGTVGEYLRNEARGALDPGGSVQRWASTLGLLRPTTTWIRIADDESEVLPNPFLMVNSEELGADIPFDFVTGPAHGDLHVENVLIPEEHGQLRPSEFRLVDLSAFTDSAPLTRDPVTLMLSVLASEVSQLRPDEQRALLKFVISPWNTAPRSRLSAVLADPIDKIYRTGHDAVKSMKLGDWRRQYLLSLQATALLFTSFQNVGDVGRWWFFRLAAHAAAAFLVEHKRYQPGPQPWPVHRPSQLRFQLQDSFASGSRQDRFRSVVPSEDRDELVQLLASVPSLSLSVSYHETLDDDRPKQQPNWSDPGAVVRLLSATASDAEVPPLVTFADRLAHVVGGEQAFSLHQWINDVAQRIHLHEDAVRSTCAESNRRIPSEQPPQHPDAHPGRVSGATPDAAIMPHVSAKPDKSVYPAGGATVTAPASASPQLMNPAPRPAEPRIWGNVPIRNPDFTGREALLAELASALQTHNKASVLPQTLRGYGGVGKTQLAMEYVYRNGSDYSLIWWIPAEDRSQVRESLAELGKALKLPPSQDMTQTAAAVLNALASRDQPWLLVYDNVDDPESLRDLLPTSQGHVIVTSRNNAWAAAGIIEVDLFKRAESVELILRRGKTITAAEADRLAEKLGDLPLALDQAANWHAETGMPISEYLDLFDMNIEELLSEGKPVTYPTTVYGFLAVAFQKLRADSPEAAQLLELFAFLGPEPVSVALLRAGRGAEISSPLREALQRPIILNRTVRDLRRFGLAKVDPNGQRIQVHRLNQMVLREELRADRLEESRANVQKLLAQANPGYPDEAPNWPMHAEIGPHIRAAELLSAKTENRRAVVLDQLRYKFKIGDYEGSRDLGETVIAAWAAPPEQGGLGPDHEQTLIASRHLGDALRFLGDTKRARAIDQETFARLRRNFGENHEHTLNTANSIGVDLRIAGEFEAALKSDEENLKRHLAVYGEQDANTLRTKNNLAVNYRILGDFQRAYELDLRVLAQWRERLSETDGRTLFSVSNLARDLYGLGQYEEALGEQRKALTGYQDLLGREHNDVLLAERTIAIALRKTGQFGEARDVARKNYRDFDHRFGADHEHTLAAVMTFANALRASGAATEALSLARDAVERYEHRFGARHLLTVAARINLAVILRTLGEKDEARATDEACLGIAAEVVGPDHPYTLCAATGLANDLVLDHDLEQAYRMDLDTLEKSRRSRGADHPYTLSCAINAGLGMQKVGDSAAGRALLQETVERMAQVLGSEHPETLDAGRGKRAECDIEPPPT